MRFFKEFRDFAMKGNVIDLAVGLIIGSAFQKIVTSLVENIIMPPIGFLIGGVNFSELSFSIIPLGATKPVLIKLGAFLQSVVDFIIIAFCLFLIVRAVNHVRFLAATPSAPPRQEQLLEEIRDLLKEKH